MADDRFAERGGHDEIRDAGRFRARRFRHLVAGLSDVHCGDAQRDQPALRDIRQWRSGHAGADARAGGVRTDVVPAESAAAEGPVVAEGQQQLRANGALTSLHYFNENKRLFLKNFYLKAKRSIQKPEAEGPAAYVLPADDPRTTLQAQLLEVMRKQAVEISRAKTAFSVAMPAKKDKSAKGKEGEKEQQPATVTKEFPPGSYIIRMDQPYSRIADALLDHQYWSPEDPQKTPYDDTGWTFGELFNVKVARVTDPKVLSVAMERVTNVAPKGGASGEGIVFAVNNHAEPALATLRFKLKNAAIEAVEEPFESAGTKFNRGTFLIRGVSREGLDRAASQAGLQAVALGVAPSVKTHAVRAARIALVHTWLSTQTEGWWRLALDNIGVPYDYMSTQAIAKMDDLNAKYDVILFPPVGFFSSASAVVNGIPTEWGNPLPWKNTPETPNLVGKNDWTDDMRPGLGWDGVAKMQQFVQSGGLLLTATDTSRLVLSRGMAEGVTAGGGEKMKIVGSVLAARLVDGASPIAYGYEDKVSVYCDNGPVFSRS